ncbi:MAG: ABC transporter ATP-binding protein [archaeon]|nr:ABC transporter ATP-binding protein/permease [Candidatus Bathyarchaeum sp.]
MTKNSKTVSGNLFKQYSSQLRGVVLSSAFANVFRGLFNILFYLVIVQITIPIVTNEPFNFNLLTTYCFGYALIIVLYIGTSMWSQTKNYVRAYEISANLRINIGNKLRKLTLGYFKENNPEKIASGLLGQVQKAELIISRSLPDIIAAGVVPTILLAFLATLNLELAAIMLASVAVAGMFLQISRTVIANMGKKHMESINHSSFKVVEYFKNIKLLKSHDLLGNQFKSMEQAFVDLNKMTFKTETFAGIPMQIFLVCLDVGYLGMFFYSIPLYFSGTLPLQHLIAFAIIGYYFYEPVKSLGALIVELRYASISVEKIQNLLRKEEPPYDETQRLPTNNDVEFENVSFAYKQDIVLNCVNAHFPENSMTALVGLSGAGKSTMTNLIPRFWDTTSGDIKIGGLPIKKINPADLLERISMVFQDVFLFNDTIANNIRLGKQNATDEEVKNAAKLACCHDFIMKLPKGYDSVAGEGGGSLSGGEKQRISIARAILKDAPIVMLDEATASLDPENESEIQKAIESLVKNKTVIVIAHKFKSIENADNILVLGNGAIIEQGTHQQLVQLGGVYNRLWKEQQKAKGWKIQS